ncbi:hypothetical protein ACWT_3444 [Actinoplanes sp. SE50]|uniref:hypothetical protein n=1 Tax=unclassified Actinoplanes TaxID=2626549 RepID=UPI00023ED5F2|nr:MULTISPECIES: hypothetical protein [unclassified Actinoplanes]AEV84467.1 hypothetical protein ACPL_3572 [Actinoplanes sp. SE50/110]ATO82859.1 hypothetical protein ACWT_3444 [Actinoplanes sp. SE50]SLM00267.1 hypothetical protein ACSP50_3499 [Actinoplanes sp. SE50/110]
MSWSFSFVAAASILGNWLGVFLDLPARPRLALTAYAVSFLIAIVVVLRALPSESPAGHRSTVPASGHDLRRRS